ncbi:MAG: hypothetical protein KF760_02625 [Candidatus Eremiobacteraeota bacterium]|nr:hypothetical protein [Candidatus Eremiobacteraeota bacterium]MCW5869459.1 hypothetical protein [Candidatus Eremiobacteraeota bacterium]
MPDLRRYRARAGSLLARERGATDQLCAGHQQFSPHRHLQDMFMSAMREALCWHILRDDGLAELCLGSALNPNGLRNYTDLDRIPVWQARLHTPAREQRDRRRWDRVLRHSLCDLGWSEPRRRHAQPSQDQLRCSAGHWHLPRVLRWQGERLFTPCYCSCSNLSWAAQTALHQGTCRCGRSGQWAQDKGVLPL